MDFTYAEIQGRRMSFFVSRRFFKSWLIDLSLVFVWTLLTAMMHKK